MLFSRNRNFRNFCSKDSRWKCRYCIKNENNNAMHQYFYVFAKKNILSSIFTIFPEQKFQMSWFSKFLFRISQNWFPKWFKMIFLWKLMKTLKKLTPLKFWGPGTKFSLNHHFLHRNCFHTSLKKILRETWGTYPHVKFDGGFENRI